MPFTKAISDLQEFAGLKVTGNTVYFLVKSYTTDPSLFNNNLGQLDAETTQYMSLPRCGVRDKFASEQGRRGKRHAAQGTGWTNKNLSYRILNYPYTISAIEVQNDIHRAFNVWSQHTDLTFTSKEWGKVDIEISFVSGDHGDGFAFYGPHGSLAHAFFPSSGGDAHFDNDEQWTVRSNNGYNMFQVAAHEFGHSLGLDHSNVRSALMAPVYAGFQPTFRLDSDDIWVSCNNSL